MNNTVYFTRNCKRRQRIGDTLIIRTDDATVTIHVSGNVTTAKVTRHDTHAGQREPQAPKSQAPKSQAPKSQAPKSQAPKSQAPKSQAAPATEDDRRALSGCGPIIPVTDRPQATEPQGAPAVKFQPATEPQAPKSQAPKSQAPKSQATEPQAAPKCTVHNVTHRAGSQAAQRCQAAQAAPATEPQATEPQATEPQATEPQATEPQATEPQDRFVATVTTVESNSISHAGTLAVVTAWLATHDASIVVSATITHAPITKPATKPQATKPATKPQATKPATKPQATKPQATKPATKPQAAKITRPSAGVVIDPTARPARSLADLRAKYGR
jgi:hypothetical protein